MRPFGVVACMAGGNRTMLHRQKTVKWGGAVVTVLLVGVWVGSGWWRLEWECRKGTFLTLQRGSVGIDEARPDWVGIPIRGIKHILSAG